MRLVNFFQRYLLGWLTLACLLGCVGVARAERLALQFYTSADGLGSSFIDYVMRDSQGFLWFCTRDGFSRFDGNSFTTYLVGDENASPSSERILESRSGTFWFVNKSGLYRYDPRTAPLLTQPYTGGRIRLTAERVSEIVAYPYEDREGRLWYFQGRNLYLLVEQNGKAILTPGTITLPVEIDAPGVRTMLQSADGSYWFNTGSGLLRRVPDGRFFNYFSDTLAFNEGLNSHLHCDSAGRIWLAHPQGLFVINPAPLTANAPYTRSNLAATRTFPISADAPAPLPEKPGEIFRYIWPETDAGYDIRRIHQMSDGHIWISTQQKGLVEYDGQRFRFYLPTQGLSSGALVNMAEDLNGNLWITGQNGAARLERAGLTAFSTADGLGATRIYGLQEARDGALYVVNGEGFLSRFDGRGFQTIHLPLQPDERFIWTSNPVLQDSRNEWWVATNKKLYHFPAVSDFRQLAQQRPLATYDKASGLLNNFFYCLYEDSRGDVWVSTRAENKDDGLARWSHQEKKFHVFTAAEGFPLGRAVSAFTEDRAGNLWVGFYSGTSAVGVLARYDGQKFTFLGKESGLPQGFITALHLDAQGSLWVSSALGGVWRSADPTAAQPVFQGYTIAQGLSSNNTRSLTEDAEGRIYIGTARGVDRLSPVTGKFKLYTSKNGLPADLVGRALRARDGSLWFGTPDGVARLVPNAEKPAYVSPVWISGLRVAGEAQAVAPLGRRAVAPPAFSYNQNNLQITFAGLDFQAERLRYQYLLEGADDAWSAPTELRTVNFAKLPAGTYRFLVRALNENDEVSREPATISFTILPPFWKRWWFLALCALVLGALVWAFIHTRLKRQRELNAAREERLRELELVRQRIARDLHDDIGASLTKIAVVSEVARQRNGDSESLGVINRVANELVDTMGDIVWAINPNKDSLSDLTQRMRRFASDVLTAKDVDLEFLAADADNAPLGANIRREVFLVCKETVNNIARHATATQVQIEFKLLDHWLNMTFRDNGRGFDTQATPPSRGGNGLANMKKRAAELGGEYHIESTPGSGTKATLRVPLETGRNASSQ